LVWDLGFAVVVLSRFTFSSGSIAVSTVAEAFAQALNYHQTGQLPQAERLYRLILQADPNHADSHHLLGVLAYQMGNYEPAVASIRHALTLNPWAGVYHANLGVAQEALGQTKDALASFQQALRLDPTSAQAHNAVGNALRALGNLDEAAAHCAQALRILPEFPEAHNNLGNALYLQGKLDEAVAHYEEALRLKPGYAEAHSNLGLALADNGKREQGIAHYHEALRINPNYADAHNNLSIALLREARFTEAETHSRAALRLKPSYADAHNNLGSILLRQSRWDEALAEYEEAMRLRANFAEAHWNRSLLWLLLGNFEQGWPDYEWRWTQPGFTRRYLEKPLWDGSDLRGRGIVLHSEQGLGDTVQFIRYAPLVKERGGTVIVECHPPLLRLLAGVPGIDHLLPEGSPLPPFDVRAPLLSLPSILRTTVATVPAKVPYLYAKPDLVEHWRQKLCEVRYSTFDANKLAPDVGHTADTGHRTSKVEHELKVGIAWQGTPAFRYDRQRSIPLTLFAPLASVEGVQLISLQKGPGTDQLRALEGRFPIVDFGTTLDEATGAFMDTAAIIKNLDLVICSDSAVAHLAGALGAQVWVALPLVPDWRWMLNRNDSPWYPTMRLFRQTRFADWDDVFKRLVQGLSSFRPFARS
jgi:tetratricopeptide (TPR) repeat protein